MLVIEALMVVMVGIFVFLLFQFLVTRHLQHLASYLRRLRLGNLHDALKLDRNTIGEGDELSAVADSINDMRTTLLNDLNMRRDAEKNLRESQNKLDIALEASGMGLWSAINDEIRWDQRDVRNIWH